MSEHGPETDCYWHQRYVDLQENFAYSFQGFAQTLEAERVQGADPGLRAELAAARAELAKLRNSKLGRAQRLLWRVSGKVRRKLGRSR